MSGEIHRESCGVEISLDYWVDCGMCGHSDGLWASEDALIKEIEEYGWQKTKEHGWICSECVKAIKEE